MPPARRRSRLALTMAEREEISRGIVEGQSVRAIARMLARAASTVSREINRNGGMVATGLQRLQARVEAGAAPEAVQVGDAWPVAAGCCWKAGAQLVARADRRLAEAGISRDRGVARVSRDHLSQPLCAGPRRAEERAARHMRSRRPIRRSRHATRRQISVAASRTLSRSASDRRRSKDRPYRATGKATCSIDRRTATWPHCSNATRVT